MNKINITFLSITIGWSALVFGFDVGLNGFGFAETLGALLFDLAIIGLIWIIITIIKTNQGKEELGKYGL